MNNLPLEMWETILIKLMNSAVSIIMRLQTSQRVRLTCNTFNQIMTQIYPTYTTVEYPTKMQPLVLPCNHFWFFKQCLMKDLGIEFLKSNFDKEECRRMTIEFDWEFILHLWVTGCSRTFSEFSKFLDKQWHCNFKNMQTEAKSMIRRFTTVPTLRLAEDLYDCLIPLLYRVPISVMHNMGLFVLSRCAMTMDFDSAVILIKKFCDTQVRGQPAHHLKLKCLADLTIMALVEFFSMLRSHSRVLSGEDFKSLLYQYRGKLLIPLGKLGGIRDKKDEKDFVMNEINRCFPLTPTHALALNWLIFEIGNAWDDAPPLIPTRITAILGKRKILS